MARLSASDVLSQVKSAYPNPSDPQFRLRSEHSSLVLTTLGLLDQMDDGELSRLSGEERRLYHSAVMAMRSTVEAWRSVSASERMVGRDTALGPLPELSGQNPVQIVRLTLEGLAATPDPPKAAPGVTAKPKRGTFGGRWQNEGSLREGGQGHTFVVTDTTGALAGKYVLKRLKNVERKDRFEREVKASLSLRHPHILRVVDSNLEAAQPYLVSEYHERGPLTQEFLATLDLPAKLRLFLQLCEGLAVAHTQGIVHRDLKPDNVLIRADDALVLADFGLCYLESEGRLTETLEVFRNWLCTAPEVEGGRDENVSPASDVYCLGKLLHWMLSGVLVPREMQRRPKYSLVEKEPKPAHVLVAGLLDKMIVEDPARRLKAAMEVVVEVESLIKRVAMSAHEIDLNAVQHCTYCGQGTYAIECDPRLVWESDEPKRESNVGRMRNAMKRFGLTNALGVPWLILRCDYCGNVQFFQPKNKNWLGKE